MEAAGIGIGLVSLASLFSTCIDCLELFQRGLTLEKDFRRLETKFTNQCIRLRAWGRTCQITEASGYDSLVDDIASQKQVEKTLNQIHELLTIGIALCKKYYPRLDRSTYAATVVPSTPLQTLVALSSNAATRFGHKLSEIKEKTGLMRKSASYASRIRWAADDRRKLLELIQHLKDFIDDLQELVELGKTDISKGFKKRQREMIAVEMEVISDIHMLETMVEMENNEETDDISSAASVRIRQLRGSSLENLEGNQSVVSRRVSESSLQSLSSEWDFLEDTSPMPQCKLKESCYQVLHEVYCDTKKTSIYLETPTYQGANGDLGPWSDLETPTSNPRSLHLSGNEVSTERRQYIIQNPHLSFLVFRHYKCDHKSARRLNSAPSHSHESILPMSAQMCWNIDHLFSRTSQSSGYPQVIPRLELKSPFLRLARSARSVYAEAKRTCQDAQLDKETETFFKVVIDLAGEELDVAELLIQRRLISWDLLDFLFVQGGLVVKPQRYNEENYQAYEIIKLERRLVSFELGVLSWDFDGDFQDVRSAVLISKLDFEQSTDGLLPFDSLPFIPIETLNGYDSSKLEERGMRLWKCRQGLFQGSLTPNTDTHEEIEQKRYIIDAAEYSKSNGLLNKRLKDNLGRQAFVSEQPPTGNFLSLLPPTVHGYDPIAHVWQRLWVSNLRHISWRNADFGVLKLSKENLTLLEATVDQVSRLKSDIRNHQPADPKILFWGEDTSAAAITARIFAERVQLPLYLMEYQEMIRDTVGRYDSLLRMKKTWRCVVHLAGIDRLIENSRGFDLEVDQNQLSSAFYQFIRKFEGILILTTSKICNIPDLVLSHFQLIIPFPGMDFDGRTHLWRSLVEPRVSRISPVLDAIPRLAGLDLSSPAIHNVVNMANHLAERESSELDMDHILKVLSNLAPQFIWDSNK